MNRRIIGYMKEELHLFIIWKNALEKQKEIIQDIQKKFEIISQYAITWSEEKYAENLSRFYGTKLPEGCDKETHCGRGTFLLILVKDWHPQYAYRKTTAGEAYVNTNMFDAKSLYREWTGGGHKIHGTNTVEETNHDLTLLLDKNGEDYLKEWNQKESKEQKKKKEEPILLKKDLLGANGFKSVEEMFYVLNNGIDYAVLRNYEVLPDEIYVNKHNDIDLICSSREGAAYLLNAKKVQELDYRVQYQVKVGEKIANFDLRYIGDKYYDEKMEKDLLKNRVWNQKGFYILEKEDYFYTLLYHALIHKPEFLEDYQDRLMKMNFNFTKKIVQNLQNSMEYLEDWLIQKKYIIERPVDLSVYFNTKNLQYVSPLVYREFDEKIEECKQEIELLKRQNKELIDELNFMKNSRTWKYTSFIRKWKK